MKTSSLFGFIFGAVLLLASCDEDKVKMHTIIYEDGHCKREVSYGTNMPDTTRPFRRVWTRMSLNLRSLVALIHLRSVVASMILIMILLLNGRAILWLIIPLFQSVWTRPFSKEQGQRLRGTA